MAHFSGLRRSGWIAPALIVTGLLSLLIANYSLNSRSFGFAACALLLAGLGLSITAAVVGGQWLFRSATGPRERYERFPYAFELVVVAVIAGAGAWYWSADNQFRTVGVVSWAGAIAAWTVAWWPRGTREVAAKGSDFATAQPQQDDPDGICPFPEPKPRFAFPDLGLRSSFTVSARSILLAVALAGILALGAFFHLARIDETPRDPTSDHAEKLLDVHDLELGLRPIYFERNTGREPLQFYATFGLMRATGWPLSFTTLKFGTGLVGMLAIPFVFLLGRELAGTAAGLMAASLLGVGIWPVAIARAGLRFPYGTLFAAATLWLLLRWMRTRDRRDALLCGLVLGAGLYGYSPIRVVIPAVGLGVLIAFAASAGSRERWSVAGHALLIGATIAVVFIPLGHYAFDHPDMFWSRASSRITTGDETSTIAALIDHWTVFLRNNLNAALGFNWKGDSTVVNGVTYASMLDVVTGALFLAGICYVVVAAVRRDSRALFLLLAPPILVLSSTLAIAFPIENPSVNREGPLAPLVFVVAALPVALLFRHLRARIGGIPGQAAGCVLACCVIVFVTARNYDAYFRRFDYQYSSIVSNTTEIARLIDEAGVIGVDPANVYVIDSPYWLDIRNIGIALGDVEWGPQHNVKLQDPIPPRMDGQPILFVLLPDNPRLSELVALFPEGRILPQRTVFPHQSVLFYWVASDGTSLPSQ